MMRYYRVHHITHTEFYAVQYQDAPCKALLFEHDWVMCAGPTRDLTAAQAWIDQTKAQRINEPQ